MTPEDRATLERVERAWETIKRALDDLDAEQRAAFSRCDNGVRATVVLNALRGLLAEGEESREPCSAALFHGPGHQSKTRCEVAGPHDVHVAHYGADQRATWRDGQYTDQLRAKGIDFDPESYPENMAMTGFFDEAPEVGP